MRKLLFAASALALAAPAFAQDVPPSRPLDDKVVRALPAPGEIEEAGEALGRVADAVMDVEIGPVVDAIDPTRRLGRGPRDRTIGDMASRDDPYARERIRDSIGAMSVGLGGMVEQLAVLTPVLRQTIEDAGRRIGDAMNNRRFVPRERADDRDYRRDERYDAPEGRDD